MLLIHGDTDMMPACPSHGQPFPSPGDLPNPGIEPRSPALQADSLPADLPGHSSLCYTINLCCLLCTYLK